MISIHCLFWRMPPWAFTRCLLILCLAIAAAIAPVYAQDQASITDISKTLDTVRTQVDQLQNDLDKAANEPLQDNALLRLRDAAQDDSEQAKKAVTALEPRSEEHTSELQSLMRTSYAGFCLKNKQKKP